MCEAAGVVDCFRRSLAEAGCLLVGDMVSAPKIKSTYFKRCNGGIDRSDDVLLELMSLVGPTSNKCTNGKAKRKGGFS